MQPPPKKRPSPPPRLGNRYQLLNPLGTGGMGAVYQAYDQLTGQMVALKRLPQVPPHAASAALRLTLAHEFQALAGLRHPGVITVRDYGFDQEGQPYFTMELLPDARNLIEVGRTLPENGKTDLLLQLLATLVYVHRCDIIHRDLKPGNVLVTPDDQVKVLDFGLAGFPGEELPAAGTLPYMAPEMLLGHPSDIRSDLFAVGLMAFELYSGQHPFAHSQNLAQSILRESPDFSGVDIASELQSFLMRLLAKEPDDRYRNAAHSLTALCAAAGRPLPPETTTRESFLQAAPFTGRTRELYHLDQARQQAASGQGSGLLLAGESGIGKSRLIQELRIRALVDGMLVLEGQAQANGPAYHLWVDPLRALLLHSPPQDRDAAVLQAIAPDTPRLLNRSLPAPPPLPAQEARNRLHLTLLDLLQQAASRQPLLLLLEDLHWADENSLALLQLVSSRLQHQPICLLGAFRPRERPQLPQQLPGLETVPLQALSSRSVADLSVAILGENGRNPDLLHFLERETEGNTFFIIEVVRALADEAGRLDLIPSSPLPASILPSGIQEVLDRRLNRLPRPHLALLQIAAVAGRRLDLKLLAHLSKETPFQEAGPTPSTLDDWLTRCANAGVLDLPLGSPTWQFSHDKLREALLLQTAAENRQKWHGQIAAALETIYSDDLAPHYGDLAYHFGQSGAAARERHYLQLAASHAETIYANEAAIDYYRRLLPLLPQADQPPITLNLGQLYLTSGRWDDAHETLRQTLQLAQTNTPVKARTCRILGRLERNRQQYETALAWLDQAQSLYQQMDDPSGLCRTLIEIANIFYHQGSYQTALAHLNQALTAAESAVSTTGHEADLALVQHNFGSIAYSRADYETAADWFRQALAIRLPLGDPAELADSYNNLGLVDFRLGRLDTARDYFEKSLALRREIGNRWATAASLANLGLIPYQERDYETARHYWQEALQIRRLLGDSLGIAGLLDNLGLVETAMKAYPAARNLMEEAVAIRRELGDRQGLAITLGNLGRLALLLDDLPAARQNYENSLRLAHEIGDQLGVVFAMTGMAGVWAAEARFEDAVRLLAAAAAHLEQFGGAWERDEKAIFDAAEARARAALAPDQFAEAWENGRLLSPAAAIALIENHP